ncbi:DUF350 domain-containing protein [Marinicrinis lubricantis]|uniref:DUF350 domain-containing protein n=1 Tax=Marinicrinis lubricantis TaxID=2086470 RepID=A0ABW1IJ96_9BACL
MSLDPNWISNSISANVLTHFLLAVISLVVCLFLFECVTRYSNWQQIKNGNVAVAMATGGKIFGIANVFRFSIEANDTLWESAIWGGTGFLLLLISYFIFEFLTFQMNIDRELERGNAAVGLISLSISVGLSYVIGASIG